GACPSGLPGPLLVPFDNLFGAPSCIDATEVTNEDYASFLADDPPLELQPPACAFNTSFTPPFGWPAPAEPRRPVGNVNWCDAFAFCAWAGKHLCGRPGGGAAELEVSIDKPVESAWFDACSHHGTRKYPYDPGNAFEPGACNGGDLAHEHAVD